MSTAASKPVEFDLKRDRLVIIASSLGTVFEWYDFFVYGTLAVLIGKLFFPETSETASFLLALATFGVGFGVRPIGAALFGHLGDKLGRKYTFLVTITLMGVATAGVGLVPSYASIGLAAPILLVVLRALQGLALGGEYGGAAIYVAEHAPANRRGFYTSFIQASVIGGFLLSVIVVLTTRNLVGEEAWVAWGWRVPFIFSIVLLGISLWIRMMLSESPVFQAMKDAGEIAHNPIKESMNSWAKIGKLIAVMLGVAAGLTVIWYTAQFQAMYFLQNSLRLEDTSAQLYIGIASFFSMFWFVLFGWVSDKYGRKKPMIAGYILFILLIFPLFRMMGDAANPQLSRAMISHPVVVSGSDCTFDPFATKEQPTACGKLLGALSKKGIAYSKVDGPVGTPPSVTIGGVPVNVTDTAALDKALADAGYKLEKTSPPLSEGWKIIIAVVMIGFLSGMTYGPVAAYLVELFPARTRYTSLSIPYHIGTGYFGGFLPFISQLIVARTGDPFAGLWYPVGVVAVALVFITLFLPETSGKELD